MNTPAKFGESFASDARTILRIVRENALLIVLCTILMALIGVYYISRAPKIYRTEAVIQVDQEDHSLITMEGVRAEDLKAVEVMKTIEQIITSPELLLRAIDEHKLRNDKAFLTELKRPATDNEFQTAFAHHVSAKIRTGTRLIDIAVDDPSPAMAQKMGQALLQEFLREGFRGRVELSKMANEFLIDEAARLKEKLAKSEQALQAYREETQTVSFEEKQNIVVEKLREMNTRVTDAKATRLKLEADCARLKKLSLRSPNDYLSIPGVAASTPVQEFNKSIADKEAMAATMRARYQPSHPRYLAALNELQTLRNGRDQAIQKGVASVFEAYEAALSNEQKLDEALREQEKVALDLSKMAITYNGLNAEAESDRGLYQSVLKQLKETGMTKELGQNAVRIVSGPMLLDKPVKPKKGRILLLSIIGGIGLGSGLGLLRSAVDTSLRTVDEAEQELGIPAVGVIPDCAGIRSNNDGLVLLKDAGSQTAEAFRSLRTSLSLLEKGGGCKSFLFSSAIPGEGKSTCAMNCAVAFAQQGLRTLLVDADLRRPSIGKRFFDDKTIAGLTDILCKGKELDEVVRSTGVPDLSVLCAGTSVPRVAELLGTDQMGDFFALANSKYDRIVVDSAPILAVSDTLLLAEHVQAVCMVVYAGQTPLGNVLSAFKRLAKCGVQPVGFILNRLRAGSIESYGEYYSAGYGEEPGAAKTSAESKKKVSIASATSDPKASVPRYSELK